MTAWVKSKFTGCHGMKPDTVPETTTYKMENKALMAEVEVLKEQNSVLTTKAAGVLCHDT